MSNTEIAQTLDISEATVRKRLERARHKLEENDFIFYSRQRLENVSMHINTEGVKLEELEFKGLSAKYYSNRGVKICFGMTASIYLW